MKISSKLFISFLAVAMIGLFSSSAYSEEEPTSEEVKTVSGTVIAVDVESNALQIREDETSTKLTFVIEESTVIKKGEEEITLADIRIDDLVDIELENSKVKTITVKAKESS
ncbi:MAG: hypothetical protein IBX60_01360 [Candidatus Aminicenantes bacterium]|nr:hypothetical protein [Candidatus Aminicenantes bacterium]